MTHYAPGDCVTEQRLQEIAEGEVSAQEIASIQSNTERCSSCRRRWLKFWAKNQFSSQK